MTTNPSLRALQVLPVETLSPYALPISHIQGYIEDAESALSNGIDKLSYCPRSEKKTYDKIIVEITETRNRLRHLKASLFALREAEVYA